MLPRLIAARLTMALLAVVAGGCATTPRGSLHDYAVRVVYAFPADRTFQQEYSDGIRNGLFRLRDWYAEHLDGRTFNLVWPFPEPCRMEEPESFYIKDPWERVFYAVADCFPEFADPDFARNFTWVVYADVWHIPIEAVKAARTNDECQANSRQPPGTWGLGAGRGPGPGNPGLTMMGGWDLYGLALGEGEVFMQCGWTTRVTRWIGGTGHELGHALGVPHPPGCDEGDYDVCVRAAMMASGYGDWPDSPITPSGKARFLASPFIR